MLNFFPTLKTQSPGDILEKIPILFRLLKAQIKVPYLYAKTDGTSKLIFEALRDTIRFKTTPEEKEWIDKIESLRQKLSLSDQRISRIIYIMYPENPLNNVKKVENGWMTDETIGNVCKITSRQKFWCLFLFKLIRKFKFETCLEMGTSLGISGSYEAAALQLNGSGELITMEGDPILSSLARGHFKSIGLDNTRVVTGRFENTLETVLEETNPIDYVFFDGSKKKESVLGYFELIYPRLSDGAILVFDDIYWSEEMLSAWKIIERDKRVKISVDTLAVGVCVIHRSVQNKETYSIPIG